MFQNQFQNTPLFEIFDSKDVLNKANKEKEKHYQQLLKITTNSFVKDFDKQLKNYIIELQGQNTKVHFPKEGDLGLVQQFLCLQIYVPQTQQWTIEFSITDTSKTKRHVYLTQNCKQIEKKPFHIRYPIEVPKNIWLNLQIDLFSFIQGWKGMTFRSLDLFVIQSPCKLRKIFTMKQADPDGSIMGKHDFPIGFEHQNLIIQYQDNNLEASQDSCQMKITSKKATGFSQQSQSQQSQKQQKLTQEKITRANIVYDDHPTPKKKTQQPQQLSQQQKQLIITSSSKSNQQDISQNEFDMSTKLSVRNNKISQQSDSVRRNDKSVQKHRDLSNSKKNQSNARMAHSFPRKPPLQEQLNQDYYIKTQKFTTFNEQKQKDDEIEENIEIAVEQKQEEIIEESQKKIITANNFNKRSLSELKGESNNNQRNDQQFEDSLEQPFKNSVTTFAQEGYYANQLKKYTDLNRPFTPEYNSDFKFGQSHYYQQF
ncbi:unnamed protein product [Paramecium pentaurelia]|uniref:CFA20 domain-containing protein n=1 Tax=Paramecium pentaurelia TaxID=43138 RepID=A0A8S1SW66_9CILI|nr:unnamed protein product [Paramecium pentaurelia]